MKFLEQQFIEQIETEIDGDGNVVIEGVPFAPAAILSADESAFTEAFDDWRNNKWLPDILQRAERILDKFDNRERFYDLLGSIRRETVTPFIGSGMSNPSGFPLWAEFLRRLCLRSTLTLGDLDAILATGDFERAAAEVRARMPAQLFDEQMLLGFRLGQLGAVAGAVRYLPEIFNKNAITLNYDEVLETVFTNGGNSFSMILTGARISEFRRLAADGERCLVKFHGDLRQPLTRVLTTEEYERLYLNDERNRAALSETFRNHKLLFLGCSLSVDRTMTLFKEIADADADIPRHVALLRTPDEETRIEREHFLTERSIFPIWYDCETDNCHDESVEAILVKILNELGKI